MRRTRHLRWKDRVRTGEHYRVVRVHRPQGAFLEYHDHDFPELFWLTHGRATHELNGERHALPADTLVWIRPGDAHRLVARGGGATMTNLELHPLVWRELCERFPQECAICTQTSADRVVPLPDAAPVLHALETAVLDLASGEASRFRLEHFLFDLLHRLRRQLPTGPPSSEPAPLWLQAAYLRAAEPAVFAGGVKRFAEVAGCSPAHLTRLTRRHYGVTAHAIIDRHRQRFAEVEIGLTRRPIQEVAFDCGFATPAQFYRRFTAWFGMPPRAFRRQRQTAG